MLRGICIIALTVVFLLLSGQPAGALQSCGFAKGDTLVIEEGFYEEYHLANPELLATNPRFASIFFIYTSWDYSDPPPGRWGVADLSLFAHYIVNEAPAGIDTDLAQVILDYFALDADPGPGLAIQNVEASGGVTHYFTIFLRDVEGDATADYKAVRLHISNASHAYGQSDWLTPEQVAMDGFAHEWQHTCHYYYSRGPESEAAVVERTFDAGAVQDFDEMCSKMSEAIFGVGIEVSNYETLYTLPTIAHDESYAQSCECLYPDGSPPDACLGDSPHYVQYGLFGNYLNSKFTLEDPEPPFGQRDLLTRWLDFTEPTALPDTVYLHDFDGLSRLIDDPAFAPYFTQSALFGPGQEGKWRELMHRFFLAEFVNFENEDLDPAKTLYQWLPHLPDGSNSPQHRYGLFDNRNSEWALKLHVYPPYLNIGPGVTRLAGRVECADLWEDLYPGACNEATWPDWASWCYTRKQLEVSSYSANYFVLNPMPGTNGRLRVRFGIEPAFECIVGDPAHDELDYSWVVTENTPNLDGQGLYFAILGYRNVAGIPNPVDNRLSEFNDEANIDLTEQGYLEHLNVGSMGELVIDGFGLGETYASAMLMLSAADHTVPRGAVKPSGQIIPYWLEVDVVPGTTVFREGSITVPTTWGPNETIWVNEDIEVAAGATLTIREGTRVWVTGAGDEVRIFGSLIVLGSELDPVELSATATYGGSGTIAGVFVETGGTCTIEYAELTKLGRFTLGSNIGGFTLSHSDVVFSDADGLAGIQTHVQQTQAAALSDCLIRNAVELKLARAAVTNCSIHQRLSGLGDYPLILVDRGLTTISNTLLTFLKLGIDTQPQSSKSGFTVALNLDAGTTFFGLGGENVTAISLQHGCNAVVRSTHMEEGLATGIEANNGASLVLRESRLSAPDVCILAASGSVVNLGVMLPDESCTPGHPGCDPGHNIIRHPDQDCLPICIQQAPPVCEGTEIHPLFHATRVFNRSSSPVWAHGNCWGPCTCSGEYFIGSLVYFDVRDPSFACDPCPCLPIFCQGGPGGGFSVVAGNGSDDLEPCEYAIDATPVFSERCTITRTGGAWVHRIRAAAVYDVAGRRVRDLAAQTTDGQTAIVWDGREESGRRAAAGVYFIRVAEASREVTFKVIKLR